MVKSDSCGGVVEHRGAVAQYKLMQDALRGESPTAAPIFFNLCGWFNYYGAAGPAARVGNAYRLATDCVGYGKGRYFLVFVQLFEKYGTLIERNTALIEKVSSFRANAAEHRCRGTGGKIPGTGSLA
eukprot:SAG31_NODE_2784_length_5092_cov_10.113158_8_plen_127_part_00